MNWQFIIGYALVFSSFLHAGIAQGTPAPTPFEASTQRVLQAGFTVRPGTPDAPMTVHFDASLSLGEGELTYTWNFGDGTVGEGREISHTYSAGGDYPLTLTVSDGSESDTFVSVVLVDHHGTGSYYTEVAVRFLITDEVETAAYIGSSLERQELQGKDRGLIRLGVTISNGGRLTTPIRVNLFDVDNNAVVRSAFIPGIDDEVVFNGVNTVMGAALFDLYLAGVDARYVAGAYHLLEEHPRFQEAVEMVRAERRLPVVNDAAFLRLMAEMARDSLRRYHQEQQ